MAKRSRLYFAALLLGALLIPTGSLVPKASARPSVAFLVATQTETLARNAFGALLPGPTLLAFRPAALAVAATAVPQRTVAAKPLKAAAGAKVVVEDGQTLWNVARSHGVTVDAIVAANGLKNAELIHPGQTLILPAAAVRPAAKPAAAPAAQKPTARAVASRRPAATQARTIIVRSGQTLSDIAQAYGVSTRALVQANNLRSAHVIRAGQRLTISGSAAALPAPRVTRAPVPPARVQIPRTSQPLAISLRRGFFSWPARGIITSRFGMRWRRHHNGIDIAAPRGTPIYAGRSGQVIFAGWYYGYGLAVMLNHGGGVVSIYGHASALLVRTGQSVRVGQQIARVGCTGSCTGNHVHFEVRINGRPVNPLRYL